MKAFIEKDLCINYALHIGGGCLWQEQNHKVLHSSTNTTSSCQWQLQWKFNLNTSKFIITKFRPYEIKDKDIITYLYMEQ